jgi:hypothetical protein
VGPVEEAKALQGHLVALEAQLSRVRFALFAAPLLPPCEQLLLCNRIRAFSQHAGINWRMRGRRCLMQVVLQRLWFLPGPLDP